MLLQAAQLVLIDLCLLEAKVFGGLGHQGLVVPDDLAAASAEDAHDFLDVGVILGLGDIPHAGSLALADVEVQARAELVPKDGLRGNLEVAGAKGVHLTEEIHQVARMQDAAVRAEVAVALALLDAAGDEHLGEVVSRDADPGIGLGILQEDIVLGLVLLDEIVLQEKGVGLAVHDGELGVGNLGDQDAGLCVQPFGRNKVLRHALVKVFCLANIDDLPLCVVVAVHTRRVGKERYFFLDSHHSERQRY